MAGHTTAPDCIAPTVIKQPLPNGGIHIRQSRRRQLVCVEFWQNTTPVARAMFRRTTKQTQIASYSLAIDQSKFR